MLTGQKAGNVLAVALAGVVCVAAGCFHRQMDIADSVTQSARLKFVAPTRFTGTYNGGLKVERGIGYVVSQRPSDWIGVTGSMRNYVHAFDLVAGIKLWDRSIVTAVGENPGDGVMFERMLVYGTGSSSLWAFDARDGETRWRYDLDSDVAGRFAGMIVEGNRLFACSLGGKLLAFGLPGGALLWKRDVGRYASGPIVTEDGIIVRGADRLTCYSRQNGALIWQQIVSPYWARPEVRAIGDKVVFIDGGAPPQMQCVKASDGSAVWSLAVDDGFGLLPDDLESVVVFRNGCAEMIHPADGKAAWSLKLLRESIEGPGVRDFRGITAVGDVLVVEIRDRSTAQTELAVLNRKSGAKLQYLVLYQNAPWWVVGDKVVSALEDNVSAWSLREFSWLWSRDFKGEKIEQQSVLAHDGEVYFLASGAEEGTPRLKLYALNCATGEITHRFTTGFGAGEAVRIFESNGQIYLWNLTAKLLFKLEQVGEG